MSDDADPPRALLQLKEGHWTCEWVNASWQEMTGATVELLVGEPIGALLPDRFVAEALGRLCDLAALTATPRRLDTSSISGKPRIAEAVPERPDDPGAPVRVVLSLAPSAAAPSSMAQMVHDLDEALELVAVFDRSLRVVDVNDAVCVVSGIAREDIVGRTNLEMGYPPALADIWDAHHRQVFETGNPRVMSYELPTVLGPRRYESTVRPEHDASGAVVAVVVTSHDVSHRLLDSAVTRGSPVDEARVTAVWEHFPPTPRAARAARKMVEAWLSAGGLDMSDHEVGLAVSELVTNAAMHAGTPLYVQAQHAGGVVRVEVHDGSTTLPAIRKSGTAGGRGLSLVAALSTSWGAELTKGGKMVWCEFVEGNEPAESLLGPHELLEFWSA